MTVAVARRPHAHATAVPGRSHRTMTSNELLSMQLQAGAAAAGEVQQAGGRGSDISNGGSRGRIRGSLSIGSPSAGRCGGSTGSGRASAAAAVAAAATAAFEVAASDSGLCKLLLRVLLMPLLPLCQPLRHPLLIGPMLCRPLVLNRALPCVEHSSGTCRCRRWGCRGRGRSGGRCSRYGRQSGLCRGCGRCRRGYKRRGSAGDRGSCKLAAAASAAAPVGAGPFGVSPIRASWSSSPGSSRCSTFTAALIFPCSASPSARRCRSSAHGVSKILPVIRTALSGRDRATRVHGGKWLLEPSFDVAPVDGSGTLTRLKCPGTGAI